MKLARLEIYNYRSIRQLDMKFGDCTLLVGKNNSGKSNIVRAIDLVLGERFFKPSKNDFYNGDESLTIKLVLHFANFSQSEIDEICSKIIYNCKVDDDWYGAREYKILLQTNGIARIELEMTHGKVEKSLYLGGIYYKYLSNELKNSIITAVHIPPIRDHAQILKTTDYAFFGKLLAKLYNSADDAKKDELTQKLTEGNSVCNEIFLEYQNRLDSISKSIIDHNGIRFSILPANPKESYRKLEILLDDGIETGLDYKGSGIQSVVIISLFKLYSEVKAGQALLLIEEPELFLHPHANRHMASVLREFCNSEGIQLIIATHSAQYLLDRAMSEIVLVRKAGKETSIQELSGTLDEVKLRKELTESNLELFFSEKVVLVEGQSDKIMLQKFAKSISPLFDFDAKNIGIIETGSCSNLDIYIDLLEAYEIPWLAIVDSDFLDSQGNVQRMSDRYNLGIDFTWAFQQKSDEFSKNGIHALSYGEIENYYSKTWLNNVLFDYLDDTSLTQQQKNDVRALIDGLTNVADVGALKRHINTTYPGLDAHTSELVNNIINCKSGLIPVNMDTPKLGTFLEKHVFDCLDLTKPKLALKVKKYADLNDLPPNKRDDIMAIIARIFTF